MTDVMKVTLSLLLLVLLDDGGARMTSALIFRVDQFSDVTDDCRNNEGKPLTYILNEDNPAMYISVDPSYRIKSHKKMRRVEQAKFFNNLADTRLLQDLAALDVKRPWPGSGLNGAGIGSLGIINGTFDCVIQIQTELPKGDKSSARYDALSLIIVELNFSMQHASSSSSNGFSQSSSSAPSDFIEISTFGHEGHRTVKVTKPAHYSDRIWAATNPNFLLSGQLSGFDSIDYRTKVDPQHLIRPELLHSTFDKPASITVNVTSWRWTSHAYMVFTSYKHLRHGERCQEHKEFDCSPPSFLSSSSSHMCMSSNLACDGLPNCGQDFLPNQDENCFKIHWSSVLLSLVSYILLAITLLLCLSCFARVLIQWSVRSSLAELRGGFAGGIAGSSGGIGGGGGGGGSPTVSFRSSSRFFSFLGNTFASRWERPPPTYDEAMKHVNPDIARPAEPPAYSDTCTRGTTGGREVAPDRAGGGAAVVRGTGGGGGRQSISSPPSGGGGGSIVATPPPEYDGPEAQCLPFLEMGQTSSSPLSSPTVVILPPTPVNASLQEAAFAASASAAGGPTPATVSSFARTTKATVEAEICCPDSN